MRYKGDASKGEIQILEEIVVHQNKFFTTHNDRVLFPDGSEGYYYCHYAMNNYGVCIMPVDRQGNMLLIRQFRHGPRRWMWEVPKGFGEHDLTALECAKKELKEETGYESDQWEHVLSWRGETLGGTHLYKAVVNSEEKGVQELEGTEAIAEVRWFSPKDLDELIKSGERIDEETTYCIMHCLMEHKGKH